MENNVRELINQLQDEDANVRYHAASALGEIGAKDAVPVLINLMRLVPVDEDTNAAVVRAAAASSLGRIGAKDAVPVLISAFQDQHKVVRFAAVYAITLNPKALLWKAVDVVPALIQVLREDQNWDVRSNSANVFGNIGEDAKDAVPALIQLLQDE